MRVATKIGTGVVGLALMLSFLAPRAEARRKGWVPKPAWNAVKKFAKQRYDPRAKLFKTAVTKKQSYGLKGAHGKAWIVGAGISATTRQPGMGFMPYKPRQAFFLVTRNSRARGYSVTPLDGMGGYFSKVDARAQDPRVGVGVGLFNPGQVGHGVEVSNALALSVTRGKALATKRSGRMKQTVYIKGDTGGERWSNSAKAKLKAIVPSGVPIPRDIPVNFSQVLFASPMASR